MPSPVHSRSLKASSSAAVSSFEDITSPFLTPLFKRIAFELYSCTRTNIVAFPYKQFGTAICR